MPGEDRVAVHVGVLHDQIAVDRYKVAIRAQFRQDVVAAVVAVEDHERVWLRSDHIAHPLNDRRIKARSSKVTQARMNRQTVVRWVFDVDGDHLAGTKQVADARQEQCATAEAGARLDHQVGSNTHQQFLVHPQIERTFEGVVAEP